MPSQAEMPKNDLLAHKDLLNITIPALLHLVMAWSYCEKVQNEVVADYTEAVMPLPHVHTEWQRLRNATQ